jgi:hypothetical protein
MDCLGDRKPALTGRRGSVRLRVAHLKECRAFGLVRQRAIVAEARH